MRQRMTADLNQVETVNARRGGQRPDHPVLQAAAEAPADLKDDEEAWHVWWYDRPGYSYQSPPKVTVFQDAPPESYPPPRITTCFVAGTPCTRSTGRGRSSRSRSVTRSWARTPPRRARLPARRLPPPQPARQDPAGLARRRRLGGVQRLPPVLAGQPGLGVARELKPGDRCHTGRAGAGGEGRARGDPACTTSTWPAAGRSSPASGACWCTTTRCPTTGSSRSTPCRSWR